jgi:hypothetical protein
MAKDKMWEPGMDIPQDEDGASVTKVDKKAAALERANQLIDEASAKRDKAQNLGKMYIGSDLSKAVNNKRANMAEEDAEVLTERAKQYRKTAEGKAKGGMISSSASSRADGCCTKGKTRGKMI